MRSTIILITALIAIAAGVALATGRGSPETGRACVARATLDGVVTAATAEYFASALTAAEREGCAAVLVELDTPGGELEATRRIVQLFLDARVPVVAYVTPSGARAGSAGVFITMAAHVAAMAPGSTIGAAHPVVGLGGDPDEEVTRKVVEDTAAMSRAIADRRGRNADWAEAAVRESISATAEEALVLDVIDLIAPTRADLLAAIDGRTVVTAAGPVELATAGAEILPVAMTIRQRVLGFVSDPSVMYVLLMLGLLGLLIELYSPGLVVPGLAGGLSLLLALIGMGTLPVNVGAIALLVIGAGLLVAEMYVVSYGLLALGGIAVLMIGAALLVDHSAEGFFADATLQVSMTSILPLALLVAAASLLLAWRAGTLRRRAAATGKEAMIGKTARAATEIGPGGGRVKLEGEHWRATAAETIPAGARVRVVDLDHLTLRVAATQNERGVP